MKSCSSFLHGKIFEKFDLTFLNFGLKFEKKKLEILTHEIVFIFFACQNLEFTNTEPFSRGMFFQKLVDFLSLVEARHSLGQEGCLMRPDQHFLGRK